MTVSRSVMSKIATWAITLLLVAGSIVTIGAQPAHAASRLGGLNLQGNCLTNSGWEHYLTVNASNAYSWRCNYRHRKTTAWISKGFDMNAVCRWQYGSGAWASVSDTKNAYSWSCYR